MSFHSIAPDEITGLSASGNTTTGGTWNTGVDLDGFTTVPSGATAALIQIDKTGYHVSGTGLGVRTTGKTNAELLTSGSHTGLRQVWVPLGTGNTIDCYVSSLTTTKFYIIGFADANWTWFDVDGTRPTIPSTGALSTISITGASIPANALIVIRGATSNDGWCPTAETSSQAGANSAHATTFYAVLDGSSQFKYVNGSSGTRNIQGYLASGNFTVNSWKGVSESYTADNTFRDASNTDATKGAVWVTFEGGGDYGFNARRNGDTSISYVPNTAQAGTRLVALDAGAWEYMVETGATASLRIMGWINAAGASAVIPSSMLLGIGK